MSAGSTPALLYVLSLYFLAVLFMFISVYLQVFFQNKGIVMGTLHYLVCSFFVVASSIFLGLGVNATGTATSLT
ncbi:hypothetical protein P2W49_11745 [Yersinia intermedia]|nr:hypothetical protein P2W49_11745 [Yersinia intermedia]